jgi:hypothetical protein
MGDHVCGIEEFDTLDKAKVRIEAIIKADNSAYILLIEGMGVELKAV